MSPLASLHHRPDCDQGPLYYANCLNNSYLERIVSIPVVVEAVVVVELLDLFAAAAVHLVRRLQRALALLALLLEHLHNHIFTLTNVSYDFLFFKANYKFMIKSGGPTIQSPLKSYSVIIFHPKTRFLPKFSLGVPHK